MSTGFVLEHFGVGVAATTGVLAARGKQVDLFGVIVLAMVTAFGGGTLRDLILGDQPVFWARDPHYVYTATVAAVVTFFLARTHEIHLGLLQFADAFALAFFTVVGLEKGLAAGTAEAIAVLLGVITGVAGGILRDLLLNEIPLVFRQDIYLYATAAFFGALVYLGMRATHCDRQLTMITAVAAVLALRLAGIRWRLTLPVFRPKETSRS